MKKIRVFDAIVFALTIIIIGGFSYFAYTQPRDNARVRIKTDSGEWTYPLEGKNGEKTLYLQGPLGETVLEISGGEVRVLSSPCREKTCLTMGPVSRPGTWLACLPNRVFVRIEGIENEEIDASVY